MVLIQLLLPATSNGDSDFTAEWAQTHGELTAAYEGLTAYVRAPARGVWTSPGGLVAEDDVVMVEIVAATFDKAWWTQYSGVLKVRFHQEAIHVRALSVDVLDPDAY